MKPIHNYNYNGHICFGFKWEKYLLGFLIGDSRECFVSFEIDGIFRLSQNSRSELFSNFNPPSFNLKIYRSNDSIVYSENRQTCPICYKNAKGHFWTIQLESYSIHSINIVKSTYLLILTSNYELSFLFSIIQISLHFFFVSTIEWYLWVLGAKGMMHQFSITS